MKKPREENRKS